MVTIGLIATSVLVSILLFRRRGLFIASIMLAIVALGMGESILIAMLIVLMPTIVAGLVFTIIALLVAAGYFEGEQWIMEIKKEEDTEAAERIEELRKWEVKDCAKASETKEEFREMLIDWNRNS